MPEARALENAGLVLDEMLGLVVAQPISNRTVVRVVAGILVRHEILGYEIVGGSMS